MKVQELAKQFGISKDLLSDVLKENGYEFNNKSKLREYVGEGTPENLELDKIIKERKSAKATRIKKQTSNNVQRKIGVKSESTDDKISLTEDEVKFIKDAYKRRNLFDKQFEITWEKSQLPPRKPEAKPTYIISEKTFSDFKKFAKGLENDYRITQNELVEIALQKLMKEWG